jgi:hypothetical protein
MGRFFESVDAVRASLVGVLAGRDAPWRSFSSNTAIVAAEVEYFEIAAGLPDLAPGQASAIAARLSDARYREAVRAKGGLIPGDRYIAGY